MTTEGNGIEDAMAAFQAEVSVEEESSDSSPEEIQTDEVAEEDAESEEVEVSDTDDEEEEVDEIDDEPELPSVEYVKADGKRVKIDYSDRDHIKRVYQKFAAQTRYQAERDNYKSELAELTEKHSKQSEMIDLLNENIEDPAEMFRLFTGGKDIKEQFREWQKEEDQFSLMSKAEQSAYLNTKKSEARAKELDKREASLNRQTQESADKESQANLTHQQSLVTSAFETVRFNEVTDADEAHSLDRRLWNDVKIRLEGYENLNKEIINKEMKDAADELRGLLGRRSRVEAKKEVKQKKTKAKKAAAKAVAKPQEEQSSDFISGLMSAMNPIR